jgi:hypothetical protein
MRVNMPKYTRTKLTVAELKRLLENIPDDYVVTYDGGCGTLIVEEFEVSDEFKKVILND